MALEHAKPSKKAKSGSNVPDEAVATPTRQQLEWLARGISQPGGKLPLFDESGQKISERTIRSCIRNGWAEPWFSNPIKPDWLVCKLTDTGRKIAT